MSACRRHYPGRFDGTDSLVPFHRRRPSPHYSWVSSCITSFEACSAFTRVTTCRLAESPYASLYTGGSGGFVASTAVPLFLQRPRRQPNSAFGILHHPLFHFGHRTSGIRFEPSPPRNSGRRHPPLPCFYPHSEWALLGPVQVGVRS